MKSKQIRRLLPVLVSLFLCAALLALLIMSGLLPQTGPSTAEFPIRGAYLSAEQGDIDFSLLVEYGISYVLLSATEGKQALDPRFKENLELAQAASLTIGACLTFSTEDLGAEQAAYFIESTSSYENMLPPTVRFLPNADDLAAFSAGSDLLNELKACLSALEAHFGYPPILALTPLVYSVLCAREELSCDLLILDDTAEPLLPNERTPLFWQYTESARFPGFGKIALSVFYGDQEAFSAYWENHRQHPLPA